MVTGIAGAGTVKNLKDTIWGLSTGFTRVRGVARTDEEKVGGILHLNNITYKTYISHSIKINHARDSKQSPLPHHPYLQHLPPY